MRIAVIGAGIAGMAAAWLLARENEVVLYERHGRPGGHTDTHDVELDGRRYAIDSGFIVMNDAHYPLLTALFAELGVATRTTTMSFSVRDDRSGVEYKAGESMGGLFAQKRLLLSPTHWRMLADIARFYRRAPALLDAPEPGPALGDYLAAEGQSEAFRDRHLVPMTAALWSMAPEAVLGYPARYLVEFMANHEMLTLGARHPWRTVIGGSDTYVRALIKRLGAELRVGAAVTHVRRGEEHVEVTAAGGVERFDQIVFACHSDEALALLADASPTERELLGAIDYADNDTVLHTDTRLLPRRRRAWAAWNAHVPQSDAGEATVSYCMNQLQGIDAPVTFVVSLNQTASIDPALILKRRRYRHPQYSTRSVAARKRRAEINGVNRSWYAGAYWGWGFHEDGLRSAVDVARALGVRWPR